MILNAAFYCFTPLEDLPALKRSWHARLSALGLKGTIILASEGINGFLAGEASALRKALEDLRTLPGLGNLTAKESEAPTVPFRKLSLKIKKEIVTFRQPVTAGAAPRLAPAELARWLDEKRDVILLDTRNAYEVRLGTFDGARSFDIRHFVELAGQEFPAEWKEKPVVTFCTGGIRCEKAAPFLAAKGFREVYQLEGGILGYFAAEGGKHWNGECFVFDDRVAVNPALEPTGARLCGACQEPVPASLSACPQCKRELA